MSKMFCGYRLTKYAHKMVTSLIEMSCGRLGIHKRFFKNEETFWKAISLTTGLSKESGEGFEAAVIRIRGSFSKLSAEKRATIINLVEVRSFYEAIGVKLQEDADFPLTGAQVVMPKGRQPRQPRQPRAPRVKKYKAPSVATKDDFYKSWEWRTLRMEVLKEHGRACQCCGAEPGMKDASGDPVRICVDHIKPLSKFWELRLDRKNLQVLCDECNQGKGAWDKTDFRKPEAPDEWVIEGPTVDDAILHQLTDQTSGRLQ